jgi:diketogulonate reductase-like aldo/keto reductase
MRASFQDSLSRLKVDEVEVLFLHEPDPSVDMARIGEALAPLLESGQARHLGSSTGAPLAQLVPFGTAAQYRYDPASETVRSATAWDAQHGVFRFLAPHLVSAISSSPGLKKRVEDIVPGGDVDATLGALCIAYVLQRCNTRLIVSTDNPARLGATLSTVRSILGLSEWPLTVELIAEAMRRDGTIQ